MDARIGLVMIAIAGLAGLGDPTVDEAVDAAAAAGTGTEFRWPAMPDGLGVQGQGTPDIDVSEVSGREACRLLAEHQGGLDEDVLGALKAKCRRVRDAVAAPDPTPTPAP